MIEVIDMSLESYADKKRILQYVSIAYQSCRDKNDMTTCDQQFLNLIERTLKCCSETTNWIIRFDFLEKQANDWYLNYFAKSSYYRLKRRAIYEFLNCLDAV